MRSGGDLCSVRNGNAFFVLDNSTVYYDDPAGLKTCNVSDRVALVASMAPPDEITARAAATLGPYPRPLLLLLPQ